MSVPSSYIASEGGTHDSESHVADMRHDATQGLHPRIQFWSEEGEHIPDSMESPRGPSQSFPHSDGFQNNRTLETNDCGQPNELRAEDPYAAERIG